MSFFNFILISWTYCLTIDFKHIKNEYLCIAMKYSVPSICNRSQPHVSWPSRIILVFLLTLTLQNQSSTHNFRSHATVCNCTWIWHRRDALTNNQTEVLTKTIRVFTNVLIVGDKMKLNSSRLSYTKLLRCLFLILVNFTSSPEERPNTTSRIQQL